MIKKIAVYPGTFDPITLGHIDVIEISSKMFDKVIVAISTNINKTPMFKEVDRQKMIEKSMKEFGFKNIEVVIHYGLTANLANSIRALTIIRGLRLTTDYESELDISFNNRILNSDISTIFIAPKQEHIHIRSSTVRELINFSKDIDYLRKYVPESVIKKIK